MGKPRKVRDKVLPSNEDDAGKTALDGTKHDGRRRGRMEDISRFATHDNPRASRAAGEPAKPRARAQGAARARRPPRRRALRLACTAALAVFAACFGARLLGLGDGALAPFRGEALSGEVSTPVAQWTRGQTPDLYQTDPAWADAPYAGGTVGENGCGPTCMTAAYVAQTGRTDMDPAAMAAFSEAHGFVESNMTTWRFMSEGARALGLRSEELPADEHALKAALAQGKTVICSVGPGDFTTQGHFIVVRGVDDEGKLRVMDPNSAERTALAWSAERVIGQCLNIWAVSA